MPRQLTRRRRNKHYGRGLKEDIITKLIMEVPGLLAKAGGPIVEAIGKRVGRFIHKEPPPPKQTGGADIATIGRTQFSKRLGRNDEPFVRDYSGIYHLTDAGSNFTVPSNITKHANALVRSGKMVAGTRLKGQQGGSSRLPGEPRGSRGQRGGSSRLPGEFYNYKKKRP